MKKGNFKRKIANFEECDKPYLEEVKGNSVSLIGTDVDVFDSNFKIKYFTYKGGLAQW